MAEVKCEDCRYEQEEHAREKRMGEIFGDKDRTFSWTVRIGDDASVHEYRFEDARGDVSVNELATMIKLFLDSGSYDYKLVHLPTDQRNAEEVERFIQGAK